MSLLISTNASKRCFWISFMTRDYRFHSLGQSSKLWPPVVDPTSNIASAMCRYSARRCKWWAGHQRQLAARSARAGGCRL